jgi:hypothetical protein
MESTHITDHVLETEPASGPDKSGLMSGNCLATSTLPWHRPHPGELFGNSALSCTHSPCYCPSLVRRPDNNKQGQTPNAVSMMPAIISFNSSHNDRHGPKYCSPVIAEPRSGNTEKPSAHRSGIVTRPSRSRTHSRTKILAGHSLHNQGRVP